MYLQVSTNTRHESILSHEVKSYTASYAKRYSSPTPFILSVILTPILCHQTTLRKKIALWCNHGVMKEEKEGSRLYFVLNESITDTAEDGAAEGTMQSASAEDDGETAVSQDSELAEEMKVSLLVVGFHTRVFVIAVACTSCVLPQ